MLELLLLSLSFSGLCLVVHTQTFWKTNKYICTTTIPHEIKVAWKINKREREKNKRSVHGWKSIALHFFRRVSVIHRSPHEGSSVLSKMRFDKNNFKQKVLCCQSTSAYNQLSSARSKKWKKNWNKKNIGNALRKP